MNYSKYFSMPNAHVPDEIELKIEKTGNITPLPFSCAGDILSSKSLQNEIGTIKLSDGSYLVAMTCPMPSVTKEMVQWGVWWHPQENERYQLWYPGEHIGISYSKKNLQYFS